MLFWTFILNFAPLFRDFLRRILVEKYIIIRITIMITHKREEYAKPFCKVYSVKLEGTIATMSSGDEVDPSPEEDWGDL